jgi:hypothetical protein
MTAQLALAQSAYGQVSGQSAYPQPAYAQPAYAASGQAARYSGMQVYDRYGGATRHAAASANSATGQVSTFRGPELWWSGKVDVPATPAAASARAAPYAQTPSLYMPAGYAPPASQPQTQPQPGAAPRGWTFVPPIGSPSPDQPALPNSIYDRPSPSAPQPVQAVQVQGNPPPVAQAQAETGPRHYSVHRDYGIEPDPIPLPPQFFGATADLSQPATDDPIRHATTTGGKAQNPLQPADGQ